MHRSAAGTVPHATRPSGRRRALTAAGLAGSLLAMSAIGAAAQSEEAAEPIIPGVISEDWVVLDRETGAWSPAEEHPDDWIAQLRPAPEPYDMAWGSQSETIAFGV